MNIGKKGLIIIVAFFLIVAVVLSIDLTRNALFNGLGLVSVTLQTWVVGAYTTITTNVIYLQWHILIVGLTFSTLTAVLLIAYYHGKLNKITTALGKTAPTTPGFQNTLTSTIPMQSTPVQTVAPAPPKEEKKADTGT